MLQAIFTSLLLAGIARAGLTDMRATIPGSIHQCEKISVFFFDTQDSGSKTLLLVSKDDAAKLGSGTLTLDSALASVTPLQQVSGINSADAAIFPFSLKVQEKVSFSTFGFLSSGQGKNLNLDRTVMSALPAAENCLAGAAAPAPAPEPVQTTSSSSSQVVEPAPTPSSTTPIAVTSSAAPQYASRFVTSTRPAATPVASTVVSSTAIPSSTAAVSLPPTSSTAPNGTIPAAAATSPVVIQAKYLLTSFISISNESTTDGTVTSSRIRGGKITGAYNGTILPVGMALFTPNITAVPITNVTTTAANASAEAKPILLSASYTFSLASGESVFVMAQTPLSQNYSSEALLMTLQSSNINSTQFSNITVLGKPEAINSTMFRIDAYYVNGTVA